MSRSRQRRCHGSQAAKVVLMSLDPGGGILKAMAMAMAVTEHGEHHNWPRGTGGPDHDGNLDPQLTRHRL